VTVGGTIVSVVRAGLFAHKSYRFALVLPVALTEAWREFSRGYADGSYVKAPTRSILRSVK